MPDDKLFDADFIKQLHMLYMKTDMAPVSALSGLRKSSAKGNSVEFSDYREYIPGDDIRRLDWNMYARLNKLYMKLFMEEKEGWFQIVIDASPSMDYGINLKRRHALRLAGALSHMILSGQDRARLYVIGRDKAAESAAYSGKAALPRVLDFLEKQAAAESFAALPEADPEGNGSGWLSQVKRLQLPAHGTTILLSDFFDGFGDAGGGSPVLEDTIKYLRFYRRQSVHFLHILSGEELNPVMNGTKELMDLENGKTVRVTLTPSLLRAYQKSLASYLHQVEGIAKKYQCRYQRSISGESLAAFLQGGMHRGWEGKGR